MPHCLHRSTNKHKHHIQLAKPRIDAGCLPTNTNKVAHWKVCGRCKCHSRFGYAFFASLKFLETNTTTQCNANALQVKEGARDQSCVILAERTRVLSLALKCEIYPWILSQIKTLNTPLEIEMETKVRHESHSYSLVELKRNGNNWNAIKDSQLERPQTHSKPSPA